MILSSETEIDPENRLVLLKEGWGGMEVEFGD